MTRHVRSATEAGVVFALGVRQQILGTLDHLSQNIAPGLEFLDIRVGAAGFDDVVREEREGRIEAAIRVLSLPIAISVSGCGPFSPMDAATAGVSDTVAP